MMVVQEARTDVPQGAENVFSSALIVQEARFHSFAYSRPRELDSGVPGMNRDDTVRTASNGTRHDTITRTTSGPDHLRSCDPFVPSQDKRPLIVVFTCASRAGGADDEECISLSRELTCIQLRRNEEEWRCEERRALVSE